MRHFENMSNKTQVMISSPESKNNNKTSWVTSKKKKEGWKYKLKDGNIVIQMDQHLVVLPNFTPTGKADVS